MIAGNVNEDAENNNSFVSYGSGSLRVFPISFVWHPMHLSSSAEAVANLPKFSLHHKFGRGDGKNYFFYLRRDLADPVLLYVHLDVTITDWKLTTKRNRHYHHNSNMSISCCGDPSSSNRSTSSMELKIFAWQLLRPLKRVNGKDRLWKK